MDAQMYRQHCAHARSSSSHVSVADLASVSGASRVTAEEHRWNTATLCCQKMSSTFFRQQRNILFHVIAASCCLSQQGHVGVQKPEERSEGRKREPPVLSFPIMLEVLGEFGGGVFDLRVPPESLAEVGVQRDCCATC